ncbi:hypothetical protein [Neisseria musculi]|uniref:hypothetical protein n=1 Tax=Neisseria musculi TaxID=1815583 RepID=UPI00164CCC98|nr:hypothetical protein [Neisseria musculi]
MMLNKICSFIQTLSGMRFAGRCAGLRHHATTHTIRLEGGTVIWETDNGSRRFDLDTLQIYLSPPQPSSDAPLCVPERRYLYPSRRRGFAGCIGAFPTLRLGRQRIFCLPQRQKTGQTGTVAEKTADQLRPFKRA